MTTPRPGPKTASDFPTKPMKGPAPRRAFYFERMHHTMTRNYTRDEALSIIGGLSNTSKMPGYSWSTSAFECITGSKLRQVPGSTCENCYATRGHYPFPNVQGAMRRRRLALSHPEFVPAFVFTLTDIYAKSRGTYTDSAGVLHRNNHFRWFDSGDLDSLETLEKIVAIANQTPQIQHWLPTREWRFVNQYLRKHGSFPPNLIVRMSTPMVGQRLPARPMGLPFSTVDYVDDEIRACPAPQQGNKCGDCRACWTPANISYAAH